MVKESLKKLSKKDFAVTVKDGEGHSLESVQVSALLRIADATELMAQRYQELQNQYDKMKQSRDYWQSEADALRRQVTSLKGVITKLRRKI